MSWLTNMRTYLYRVIAAVAAGALALLGFAMMRRKQTAATTQKAIDAANQSLSQSTAMSTTTLQKLEQRDKELANAVDDLEHGGNTAAPTNADEVRRVLRDRGLIE